jgi:hypothetical protein
MSNDYPPNALPPDHIGVLLAAAVMFIIGWGGLYWLVTTHPPRLGAELWLFFFLGLMAITGTVVPIVRYLNMAFTPVHAEPIAGGIIVRQSVWIGLFCVILAWMQILRVISPANIFFLALVFIIIEVFLRSRERDTSH